MSFIHRVTRGINDRRWWQPSEPSERLRILEAHAIPTYARSISTAVHATVIETDGTNDDFPNDTVNSTEHSKPSGNATKVQDSAKLLYARESRVTFVHSRCWNKQVYVCRFYSMYTLPGFYMYSSHTAILL